jgi:hypothetical protein
VDVSRYREGEQVVVPEGVLFGLTAPEEAIVVERRRREVRGVEVISEVSAQRKTQQPEAVAQTLGS